MQTTFTEGFRVCFLLRVDFPAGSETKNAVLTDFLPDSLTYEAGSAAPLDGYDVTTSFDASSLTFILGDQIGGNRFVPRGSTFLYRVSGVVTQAPLSTPDIIGNLAKLRWVNTAGTVGFPRDREDFSIAPAPPVSIVKSANRVSATAPGNRRAPPSLFAAVSGTSCPSTPTALREQVTAIWRMRASHNQPGRPNTKSCSGPASRPQAVRRATIRCRRSHRSQVATRVAN